MADTYNQKTDRQDTAGSVYQKEIFKRRSRYILVFSVLTAAFLIVTVLNTIQEMYISPCQRS